MVVDVQGTHGLSPLIFVTSNKGKLQEAQFIMKSFNIEVISSDVKKEEIQADNIESISMHAAVMAARSVGHPFIVEDDGLFIDSLNGFPGPYTAYALKTLRINGILRLMSGKEDRNAYFKSSVTLYHNGIFRTFTGITKGIITYLSRGNFGFGFDPIFKPSNTSTTFAELSISEKSSLSHRGKALSVMGYYMIGLIKSG